MSETPDSAAFPMGGEGEAASGCKRAAKTRYRHTDDGWVQAITACACGKQVTGSFRRSVTAADRVLDRHFERHLGVGL